MLILILHVNWYDLSNTITFSQRGARNSFTVMPISPYAKGQTQNPHSSQKGIDAETQKVNTCSILRLKLTEKNTGKPIVNLTSWNNESSK